jgi:2-oxoglutarate/2-oxoacid ferredoxin oxidoreductase subunit beta
MSKLKTDKSIEWCPGCGNFGILDTFVEVVEDLVANGTQLEKFIIVSGVGNHAKIVDYVNINSFYSIHGRALPVAEAIKLADPDARVICFVGDGDSFAEGLDHLIFAAKRNSDITVVVHDNRTYGLATGQFTPTSQEEFTGGTMPDGAKEEPFNPLELMLVSGATYIGRGYPIKKEHFKNILKEAILHKGFSIIDTLQVCVTFNNLYKAYNKNVYEIIDENLDNMDEALKKIRLWNYKDSDEPIPIGSFFKVSQSGFEEKYQKLDMDRETRINKVNDILNSRKL